ncbi:F-box only protein 5-like [Ornithodoros turicata]|uniref:F-box only protein 5-like n=1 Tax=Ornithodoros turicata TaxID=34597 RepID=UPI00313A4504
MPSTLSPRTKEGPHPNMESTPSRPPLHGLIVSSTPVSEPASHDSGYTSFGSHKSRNHLDSTFTEGNHSSIHDEQDSLLESQPPKVSPVAGTVQRVKYSSVRKRRSHLGRLHVDFLKELQTYEPVLDQLLGKLTDEDLSAVCRTSGTWRSVCLSVHQAAVRWKRYIQMKRDIFETNRENLPYKKFHSDRPGNSDPLSSVNWQAARSSELQRSSSTPQVPRSTCHIFVQSCSEESAKTEEVEAHCPACSQPNTVSASNNDAACSSCGHHFCVKCLKVPHKTKDCDRSTFSCLVTPETKKPIGSKASKHNLRRL